MGVVLPPKPDLTWLRAFGASCGLFAAAVGGSLVAWVISAVWGVAAGLIVGGCVTGLSWIRPPWSRLAYRSWSRLGRAYARRARWLLIGILHYMLLLPVGRLGGRGEFWQSPTGSGWVPHAPADSAETSREGWWRLLVDLSRRPGRLWTVTLLPLLAALRLLDRLDARPGGQVPSHMYTLY